MDFEKRNIKIDKDLVEHTINNVLDLLGKINDKNLDTNTILKEVKEYEKKVTDIKTIVDNRYNEYIEANNRKVKLIEDIDNINDTVNDVSNSVVNLVINATNVNNEFAVITPKLDDIKTVTDNIDTLVKENTIKIDSLKSDSDNLTVKLSDMENKILDNTTLLSEQEDYVKKTEANTILLEAYRQKYEEKIDGLDKKNQT